MRMTEPVEITREYIMRHRTKRGSWTKVQIEALGLTWPPHHGWIDEIVGNILTPEKANKFESKLSQKQERKNEDIRKSIENIDDAIEYLDRNIARVDSDQLVRLISVAQKVKNRALKFNNRFK